MKLALLQTILHYFLLYFVDYGSIPQTDAEGNVNGNFYPVDYVVQVSAIR